MLNSKNRGSALTIVVALVVIVILGAGLWYFLSDPFSTRVNEAYKQGTEWTAENIQANPVGYLTWALSEVDKTEDKLEAGIISLKTKKSQADRALSKNTADKTQYETLLVEFKTAYKEAKPESKFPVSVRGVSLDEPALKKKIVESNDKIQNLTTLVDAYSRNKQVIETKLAEIEAKQSELVKLKNKLSTDLEIAKVNKSVDGLNDIGDTLNAITDTSNALVADSQDVSIEAMIKPVGDARVDEEFDKIMAQ